MRYAAKKGEARLFQLIASDEALINAINWENANVGHEAASCENEHASEVIDSLITILATKYPGDINQVNSKGQKLLHVAAEQGNLSVVQVMKSLPQISLELQDYTGRTPKQTALEQGYFQIAGMLDQPQHTHRLMDANGYRPFICDEPFNNIPDQMPQPGQR